MGVCVVLKMGWNSYAVSLPTWIWQMINTPNPLMLKLEADVENWEEFRVPEPRQLKDLEARQNVTHMKAQRCHQRIWSEEQSWENTAAARGACSSPWRHAVN